MPILAILLVGLIFGIIAKSVMPARDPAAMLLAILLGVVGSLFAGALLASLLGWSAGAHGPGLVVSVIGALILLTLYRLVTRREIH
jgi:uncharacterized membrane protein YeaQ/YmgE (transglycosylase-associated protein family)